MTTSFNKTKGCTSVMSRRTSCEATSGSQTTHASQFNKAKGGAGEGIAGIFLKANGFELVQNNYRNKHGEIDIIATKYKIINGKTEPVYHFVEVKFRLSDTYGHGREAVNKRKQKHIRSTAEYFLIENGLHNRVFSCFDVIEITGSLDNPHIEYLENCF